VLLNVSSVPVQDRRALSSLVLEVAGAGDLASAAELLVAGVSNALNVPAALLSFRGNEWRFEAESVPAALDVVISDSAALVTAQDGQTWAGIPLGTVQEREWLLVLPREQADAAVAAGFDRLVALIRDSLAGVARIEAERNSSVLARRVYAFSRRLARRRDAADLHRLVVTTIARAVSAGTGALAIYRKEEEALEVVATHGYPTALVEHLRIRPGAGVIGKAFEARRASIERALAHSRRLRYRTDSFMIIPLVADGACLGVVAVTDRLDGRAFDGEQLAAARLLAAPAALALARARLDATLVDATRAATVDPLTGLFNRRYFESRLEAELGRARRQNQDLALLMVDIDDFKRINDTYGHLRGDRVLKDVADLIRSGIRIFDVCARFGGEEFAIIMPGANVRTATQVAERIRGLLAERSQRDAVRLTISIGIGLIGDGFTAEDLIASADRALIAAKKAGKNVVHTASQKG
jgi:diguanylate cyclase (GGDEF)-like protein